MMVKIFIIVKKMASSLRRFTMVYRQARDNVFTISIVDRHRSRMIVGEIMVLQNSRSPFWYIHQIKLKPEYRGLGMGTALLCKVGEIAMNAGVPTVVLLDEREKKISSLYERLGFRYPTKDARMLEADTSSMHAICKRTLKLRDKVMFERSWQRRSYTGFLE